MCIKHANTLFIQNFALVQGAKAPFITYLRVFNRRPDSVLLTLDNSRDKSNVFVFVCMYILYSILFLIFKRLYLNL